MTKAITTPPDLLAALRQNPQAEEAWNGITDIGRRDFISWIETAKKEETREKRIRVAIDKLHKGQKRPCCYAVVPMDLYRALGDNPSAKAMWSKLDANEKRDFSDWVEASPDKDVRKARVALSCASILEGKRKPTQ